MKRVIVVGAGLSGLIAANLLKSRGYDIEVYESQTALPDNHQAVLRFRSPILGEVLGIPFKRVQALLCLAPSAHRAQNPMLHALAYSYATTGNRRTDRSITRLLDGPKVVERWVAPPDFRSILFERIENDARLGHPWEIDHVRELSSTTIVSTIPMNATCVSLWKPNLAPPLLEKPDFQANQYVVISADVLNTDAYGSIYNPYTTEHDPWTRISINGSRAMMEISLTWTDNVLISDGQRDYFIKMFENILTYLLDLEIDYSQGSPQFYHSRTDRILPIPDRFRKAFIMHLTDKHNVYSLGRFATWRPGMLLDEIIQDTNIIASMIEGDTAPRYEAKAD